MLGIPNNENLKLERKLKKFIQLNQKNSTGINIYSIQFTGVPWWGSALSWITACYSLSILQSRLFAMGYDDNWRLVPKKSNIKRNWRFYFDSLPLKQSSYFFTRKVRILGNISPKFGYRIAIRIPKVISSIFPKSSYFNNFQANETNIANGKQLIQICGNHLDEKSYWARIPSEVNAIFDLENIASEQRNSIWKSFLAREIFKPASEFKSLALKSMPFVPSDYIAIHCRRGDKVAGKYKESSYIPTKSYLDEAILHAEKMNINNLFLVSDSDEFIEEFKVLSSLHYKELVIFYDQDETRHDGFPAKIVQGKLEEANKLMINEMTTALKNTWILAQADYLIGSKASWFFQFAHRLRITSEDPNGSAISLQNDTELWGSYDYHF